MKIWLPIIVAVIALTGAWSLWASKPEQARGRDQERIWTVAASPTRFTDEQPLMRLYGKVIAGREVELRPLVAGLVVEVGGNFLEGGVVHAGDLLVAIDPFDYEITVADREAQLAEARAKVAEIAAELEAARALFSGDKEQVAIRRRDVERREKLRGTGAGSVKALDDARMTLSEQEQRVIDREKGIERLEAKLAQQRAVVERMATALRQALRDREQTKLTAPFDGFLVDVATDIGKRISVGDRVARLIDAGRLEVRFHVSKAQYGKLLAGDGYKGRTADAAWQLDTGEVTFGLVIDRAGGEIDPTSGGVDLFARIPGNGPDTHLRPGLFVEVRVRDQLYENIVRVSETALHDDDTVYAIVDSRLVARKVRVVARTGEDVLLQGELTSDELLVTTRFPEIGPGVRVRVQ